MKLKKKTKSRLRNGLLTEQEGTDMLNDIVMHLDVEYDEVYLSDTDRTPSKSLLGGLLERAVLDLFIKEHDRSNLKYRTQAIKWFLSPVEVLTNGFSFLQVVHYLDMGKSTAIKLVTLASSIQNKQGEYYDLYTRYRSRNYRRLRYSK